MRKKQTILLETKNYRKIKKKINEKRLSLRKKWKRDHVVFFSYREKFTEQKFSKILRSVFKMLYVNLKPNRGQIKSATDGIHNGVYKLAVFINLV